MKGLSLKIGVVLVLLVAFLTPSCKTVYVPLESNVETHYVDSVRWEIRDSIRITERSRWKEWGGLLDELVIEGNRATARCWADTTRNILAGELEESPIEEKTKVVYKTKWMIKDSIRIEEKPVPYEVVKEVRHIPRFFKFCLWWFIGSVVAIVLYLYLKFKMHISI